MNGEIIVRTLKSSDVPDIHALRVMPGVFENVMSTPFEELEDVERFMNSQGWYSLGAEADGRIIGVASLMIYPQERRRHCASLGIMIHKDFQGQGIGKVLMNALLDGADNWLMLKRIELEVFTDNERAVKLYEALGFIIEGTKKYAAVKNGVYSDLYMMARYNVE